ncbi:cell wall-binding repeat-containing protein [Kineococcus sp. SYSU DK003]|uniref:cell wall-binding repeat-containing protein n=1 Tax=Kineococcus sp. SYSU DK003 TaxID=3383124 RepID=UPI003D7D9316
MRTKTFAALAAVGLAGTVVASAGAASAADAPVVERGKRAVSAEPLRGLKTAVSGEGNVRISGNDRYETAADISFVMGWEPGNTFVVFLASGTSSADALALGASTGDLGPVLLTEKDRLPEATRAELQRLQPCMVVVAGGAASVSDAVFAEAERYVDTTGCPAS